MVNTFDHILFHLI